MPFETQKRVAFVHKKETYNSSLRSKPEPHAAQLTVSQLACIQMSCAQYDKPAGENIGMTYINKRDRDFFGAEEGLSEGTR